jgi:hypothetical protein
VHDPVVPGFQFGQDLWQGCDGARLDVVQQQDALLPRACRYGSYIDPLTGLFAPARPESNNQLVIIFRLNLKSDVTAL